MRKGYSWGWGHGETSIAATATPEQRKQIEAGRRRMTEDNRALEIWAAAGCTSFGEVIE